MTKSVTIDGIDKTADAAEWCRDNIRSKWNIQVLGSNMFQGKYAFEFEDPLEASHFALKWR